MKMGRFSAAPRSLLIVLLLFLPQLSHEHIDL